jgi:hypothetical protein
MKSTIKAPVVHIMVDHTRPTRAAVPKVNPRAFVAPGAGGAQIRNITPIPTKASAADLAAAALDRQSKFQNGMYGLIGPAAVGYSSPFNADGTTSILSAL